MRPAHSRCLFPPPWPRGGSIWHVRPPERRRLMPPPRPDPHREKWLVVSEETQVVREDGDPSGPSPLTTSVLTTNYSLEDPLGVSRGLLLGWALSLALGALAVVLAWCWR